MLARGDARQRRQLITPKLTQTAVDIVEQHAHYTLDHKWTSKACIAEPRTYRPFDVVQLLHGQLTVLLSQS